MSRPFSSVPIEQMLLDGATMEAAPAASATVEIPLGIFLVRVTTPASGTGVVKLPSAIEAAGRTIVLRALNTGGGEVKIAKHDGSTDAVGDNLSAAADVVVLLSDGEDWIVLKDVTT